MGVQLYGLLYVGDEANVNPNLRAKAEDALAIYLGCATLQAKSAAAAGVKMELITNAPERLAALAAQRGYSGLTLRPHEFQWRVPHGIDFHSAHFKLEVFEAFATGAFGRFPGLVDIDTVVMRDFTASPALLAALEAGALCAYDIQAQMRPANLARYPEQADLETFCGLAPRDDQPWFGGEFLIGSPDAYAVLAKGLRRWWEPYLAGLEKWAHIGDEFPLTVALSTEPAQGLAIHEAGAAGYVARWWSSTTLCRQKTFREASEAAIWHLPADKAFMARYALGPFDAAAFQQAYMRYAQPRLFQRRAAALVRRDGRLTPEL